MNLAVLVSGSGTLLEAMIEHALPISLVVADRECRGLTIAEDHGIANTLLHRPDFGPAFDRDGYAERMVALLRRHHIDLVAMAGFGTIMGKPVFDAMPSRVINTHPSLLPSFPGWHAVRDALDFGVRVTGCTIHLATPEVDQGPILAQVAVDILEDDNESTLHERIKVVERKLYVDTLQAIQRTGLAPYRSIEEIS